MKEPQGTHHLATKSTHITVVEGRMDHYAEAMPSLAEERHF